MGRNRNDELRQHDNGFWYYPEWDEKHGKNVPRSTKRRNYAAALKVFQAKTKDGPVVMPTVTLGQHEYVALLTAARSLVELLERLQPSGA